MFILSGNCVYHILAIRIGSHVFKLKFTKDLLFSERERYCKFRKDFGKFTLIYDHR